MKHKAPFFIIEDFISPLACEDIIFRLEHTFPNKDLDGKPLKTIKANRLSEIRVMPLISEIIPDLEEYFNFEYKGTTSFDFEWFPTGFKPEPPRCENSILKNGNWIRINENDFTGIIFLNDYQDTAPFDPEFEVAGGRLEFINHNFKFNPKRGTLLIFPSSPHFVNHTEKIVMGNLNQIRFQISAQDVYNYDPTKFPGTYESWFLDK